MQLQPHDSDTENDLAYVLAASPHAELRDGHRALELAREASESTGGRNPAVLRTLAAAYAETGQYAEAAQTAQRALELVDTQSMPDLAKTLQSEIALYQSGKPFRDTSLYLSNSPDSR